MENLLPPGHTKLHVSLSWYVPALLGVSLIIAAAVGAYAFYSVHAMDNVLSVTGSTKVAVTSDTVKWRISISQKVLESNLQSGYPLLAKDLAETITFLRANGIPEDAITTSPVYTEEVYNYNANAVGPREYNLRQEVTIQSKEVQNIDALSKRITELSSKGVFVQWNNIEYFVSNLPELRVNLLGDAITDARARAEQIAAAGGQKVGALKAASSGVVQVLSPNSVEVTDYGSYDTQSIEKEVMVTARATFFVR